MALVNPRRTGSPPELAGSRNGYRRVLAGKLLWVAVKRRKQTPPPSAIGEFAWRGSIHAERARRRSLPAAVMDTAACWQASSSGSPLNDASRHRRRARSASSRGVGKSASNGLAAGDASCHASDFCWPGLGFLVSGQPVTLLRKQGRPIVTVVTFAESADI